MVWPGPTPAYQGFLNDRCVTIAEVLQGAGYRTLMSGKWHVGGAYAGRRRREWSPGGAGFPTPRQRGFDEFFGTLDGAGSYFQPATLICGDTFVDQLDPDWYYTDAISDAAARMAAGAVSDGVPFFLYVAYTAPHWPLHALSADIDRYLGAYDAGWDELRTTRHDRMKELGVADPRWKVSARDPSAPAWEDAPNRAWESSRMAVYAAQIDRMDQGVGHLVAQLQRDGILDDTLLMFLSDNGGASEYLSQEIVTGFADLTPTVTLDGRPVRSGNDPAIAPGGPDTFASYDAAWANASNTPFRRFKQWMHEGGTATPMIVHWPKRVTAPDIVHTPAHIVDIMPTCLDAAGVPFPEEHDARPVLPCEGQSLVPAFTDSSWRRPGSLFFEHEANQAIWDEEWKLVRASGGPWELYDILDDRCEGNDLAASVPTVTTALAQEWTAWARRVGVYEP